MTEDNDRLRRALKLLPWNRSWRICSLDSRSCSDVLAVLKEIKVNWDYNLPFDNLYCSVELARQISFSIPNSYTIRRLAASESATVNDLWTYRHPGSEVGVRRLIERNYCVGVFDKNSEMLLGWCLTFISQCHNALQIRPEFMRRGLGRLVVGHLTRHRAEQGKWSNAFVSPTNEGSQRLFAEFGFTKIGVAFWIGTRPREE